MRVPVPEVLLPADQLGTVHFVGIGGAGLSGIARIMLARGITVSGQRRQGVAHAARRCVRWGRSCHVGHDAARTWATPTRVVISTAVRETNPEVVEATHRGLRLLPRSAALESVMQEPLVVAVAGTHGKTTTTSLLTVALQHCGADPSFAIGGDLNETGSNAHHGSGELFVAEADESDGAFLVYSPYAALVTNVEADHLDNYGTEEAYRAAFDTFIDRVAAPASWSSAPTTPGADAWAAPRSSVGARSSGSARARTPRCAPSGVRFAGATSRFTVVDRGRRLGEVTLQIPGRHYVLDALAALACGLRLGFGFQRAGARARGVQRHPAADGAQGPGRRRPRL